MPTKIPGNQTHAELAAAFPSGYVPRTKIHLQELLPGGKAGPRLRELRQWEQITIQRQIGNKGRCVIALNNANDRFFNNKAKRIFRPEKEAGYKSYLRDLHRRCLPFMREINPDRRKGIALDFQGARSFDEGTLAEYINFVYNFDGWDGGVAQAGGQIDLPALGLVQRMTVDSQGVDGAWYAMFTGVVSGIDDSFRAGETPTINLVCSDYWRLFDLSEIVIRAGSDLIVDNLQREFSAARASQAPYQDAFANATGAKILQIVMDTIQRTMCWAPYSLWKSNIPMPDGRSAGMPKVPSGPYPVKDLAGKDLGVNVSVDRFFNQDPFWWIPFSDSGVEPVADYEGLNNLRRYARPPTGGDASPFGGLSVLGAGAPTFAPAPSPTFATGGSPLPALPAGSYPALSDGQEPVDGMAVAQLYATLLVDKYIQKGSQGLAYAQYIQSILQPWQTNAVLGSVVVRRVASATFYDVMITSNGDVLYQIPKYNNCPAEYQPRGVVQVPESLTAGAPTAPAGSPAFAGQLQLDPAIGVGIPGAGLTPLQTSLTAPQPNLSRAAATSLPSEGLTYDDSPREGEYDYSPPPEGFAQKHHGWNYAITSVGTRGWHFPSNEEGIVTTVRVPAGQGVIDVNPQLETRFFTGRSRLEETQPLVNRFGLRAFEAQKVFIQGIYNNQPLSKDLLDRFALALMVQLNAHTLSGTWESDYRPDLDEGKNIFHVERQRLLYVLGVNHTIRFGQDASTSLQLAYGHDVSREVYSPFVAVRDLLTSITDEATAAAQAQPPTPVTPAGSPGAAAANAATIPGVGSLPSGPPPPPAPPAPTDGSVISRIPLFRFNDTVYTQAYIDKVPGIAQLQRDYTAAPNFFLTAGTPKKTVNGAVYIDKDPGLLLQEAQKKIESQLNASIAPITQEEYSLARLISSEAGGRREPATAGILVAQGAVNTARIYKVSVDRLIRRRGFGGTDPLPGYYGANEARSYGASQQDPTYKAFIIARRVLSGATRDIIPNVTNVYGLKASIELKQPARKTLFRWTSANLMWAGQVAGIQPNEFLFLAQRDRASDALARQKSGQAELLKYLAQFGL